VVDTVKTASSPLRVEGLSPARRERSERDHCPDGAQGVWSPGRFLADTGAQRARHRACDGGLRHGASCAIAPTVSPTRRLLRTMRRPARLRMGRRGLSSPHWVPADCFYRPSRAERFKSSMPRKAPTAVATTPAGSVGRTGHRSSSSPHHHVGQALGRPPMASRPTGVSKAPVERSLIGACDRARRGPRG
jgi:hypothetical protein